MTTLPLLAWLLLYPPAAAFTSGLRRRWAGVEPGDPAAEERAQAVLYLAVALFLAVLAVLPQ